MIDFDRLTMAPAFTIFGEAATYAPPTGPAVPCRVVREGGGVPLKLGPITVHLAALTFEVRAAELAAPAVGGTFTVGGIAYTVTGAPYHPEEDAHGLVWCCPTIWGAPIIYRTPTGNGAMLNPPTGSGWTVATAAAAGATAISTRATLTTGRLLAGDKLTVGGETYTITAPVSAASNVFSNVPITPPLAAPVAVGVPVTFEFACDRPVLAAVAGYDASQLLGGIVVGSRRVVVTQERLTAAGIPTPNAADSVFIEGRQFRVKNAAATYSGATPFVWDLECGA
ncbi:hypothetical protein D3093_11710 [Azospirillum argentinense]|uniref:Uncharacterized protein n=1 Tax=Azospirillum argentinense TaxID=2970906 RepID=A0A4D8PKF4_9PROT|nr:hypothetical protein [Azospirillum argentinense]QCN95871.1 hypothetical protein D3093_11710 [Azospirillum argentinense]